MCSCVMDVCETVWWMYVKLCGGCMCSCVVDVCEAVWYVDVCDSINQQISRYDALWHALMTLLCPSYSRLMLVKTPNLSRPSVCTHWE